MMMLVGVGSAMRALDPRNFLSLLPFPSRTVNLCWNLLRHIWLIELINLSWCKRRSIGIHWVFFSYNGMATARTFTVDDDDLDDLLVDLDLSKLAYKSSVWRGKSMTIVVLTPFYCAISGRNTCLLWCFSWINQCYGISKSNPSWWILLIFRRNVLFDFEGRYWLEDELEGYIWKFQSQGAIYARGHPHS